MTKQEFKDSQAHPSFRRDRFTVLSREDIYKALVDEGFAAADEKLDSLDYFLAYIRFPVEGTVAYYSDEIADARDWIRNWDEVFMGWYEHEGDPDETLDGYLETMHGLTFREGCTGTDELEDGQWFCEKVVDEYGQMEIRRYSFRCADDTFVDIPAGVLCSYLMLDNYVFDEYDSRFNLLERFLNVDEILKQVKED